MFYSDDPVRDFDRDDAYQAQQEAKLPKCEKCGKPINDDVYYEIEGETLCENCMRDAYGRSTEDYLRDNY